MNPQKQQPSPPEVRLAESELARREGERIIVRAGPMRIRFEMAELVTGDGHRLQVTFDCAVAARPEAAERQMLAEAFLGGAASCSGADVVREFMPGVSAAARQAVAGKPVAELLTDGFRPALAEVLKNAVDAAGFTTGLEAVAPYGVHLESPSVQRMERDRANREQAEREQVDRLAHLRRSAEVLKEFEAIRAASPGLPVSVVLSRMTAADQSRVVQGLIEAGERQTATLYAVAGPCLVRVSTGDLAMQEIAAPAEVGPFRSVHQVEVNGRQRLALGGRGGVVVVEPSMPEQAEVYRAADVTSAMGFNRVVVFDGRVWASHSEVGIVAWELGAGDAPATRMAVKGARNLQVAGGRLVYTAGSRVAAVDGPVAETQGEAIVALFVVAGSLVAVRGSGEVDVLDVRTLEVVKRDRRSARVSAAGVLPFFDSPRLVLAGEDGPVTCLSPEDSAVMQYSSPHRGLRAIAATAGTIAGVSADRQRVVLFDAGSSRVREAYVGARVRHRVGDITFAR